MVVHLVRMVRPIILQGLCGDTPSLSKKTQKASLCVNIATKNGSKYN
jgi:hypothetical protein